LADVTGEEMTNRGDDELVSALVEQLRAMRAAEREIFGSIEPEVRDRPMRPNDWSPKDHQAHLTAWKEIQAERLRAIENGDEPLFTGRETDEINAELQATRSGWAWDAIADEADKVTDELVGEIARAGPSVIKGTEGLVGQIFGNGAAHALTHFGWLVQGDVGVNEERVASFIDEHEQHLAAPGLSDSDRGVGLYNLACAHAVAGRLDRARPLLKTAFKLRPDLAEFAKEDPDLVGLRDDLSSLVS
jgi:DinB family protein